MRVLRPCKKKFFSYFNAHRDNYKPQTSDDMTIINYKGFLFLLCLSQPVRTHKNTLFAVIAVEMLLWGDLADYFDYYDRKKN